MTLNQYQDSALQFADYSPSYSIIYPALGLAGESGEVVEKIKKVLRDNNGVYTDEAKQAILKELGDVLWYISTLSRDLGFTLEQVAATNISKLTQRVFNNTLHGSGDDR